MTPFKRSGTTTIESAVVDIRDGLVKIVGTIE